MVTSVTQKLEEFFSQFPSHTYKKGDILIQAHLDPSGIFYIEEGIVRSYWISEEGIETTLNMFKPHTFIPMSWAIGEIHNANFFEAMTPVMARKAPKERFLTFIKNEPDILFDLLRRVYVGLEGVWMHIESLTSGNSYVKLIASLVILAKRFGRADSQDITVELKMSESDIANYAGMSRETASRELQKLKKDNLVSFQKRTLIIHNIQELENRLLQ